MPSFAVLIACAHLERADFCYRWAKDHAAEGNTREAAMWRGWAAQAERCGKLVWQLAEGEKVA